MWKPPLDFIALHYMQIIFSGLLGLVVILPYGNVAAIDAYFFGVSASTESGLNTIDVKDLKTYQQLFIYFAPIITNLGFINIVVIVVRVFCFKRKFKAVAPSYLRSVPEPVVFSLRRRDDVEAQTAHPEDQAAST